MSEITPLTKDQLFEKKIAENTGSDYNVGDISDVVPVTKDQSFLKEIALNSAGQSEDITELEEKVTANAEAIEAMVNVTGSCNIAPNNASTTEMSPVTFTVNSDKSVSVSRTGNNTSWRTLVLAENIKLKAGTYILSSGYTGDEQFNVYYELIGTISGSAVSIAKTEYSDIVTFTLQTDITDGKLQIPVRAGNSVFNNVTIYPMLYDARLTPTGYVQYAMTNRELTEKQIKTVTESFTTNSNSWILFPSNRTVLSAYIVNEPGLDYVTLLIAWDGGSYISKLGIENNVPSTSSYSVLQPNHTYSVKYSYVEI